MVTCPACGERSTIGPSAGSTDVATPWRVPTWLSRGWLGALAVPLSCCCGGYLLRSVVAGDLTRALITVLVVGGFVALAVVDTVLPSGARRPAWRQCPRCQHVWLPDPPQPAPARPVWSTVGWRTLHLVRTIVLPWNAAAFLLAPRHRLAPENDVVRWLSRIRAVLGLGILIGVALRYRSFDRVEPVALVENWVRTGLLAVPGFLLCMGLLAAVTRKPLRGAAIRQMRWPALSLLAFAGTVSLLVAFSVGAGYVSGRVGDLLLRAGIPGIPLDGFVYGGVFGLWLLIFCLRSAYLVTQNWFNAADGHVLLPPLIATWMAWLVAGTSLIFEDGDGSVPSGLNLVLIIGGAVTTTAVAALEASLIVRRFGVTLRNGPWPAGRATATKV